MTLDEAKDLLSIAARSSTWAGADPKLAAELMDVLTRLEAERDSWQRRPSPIAHADSLTVVEAPKQASPRAAVTEAGTPRGPELDAVRERCECGHPWSKHRPGKYGGCCEWGCMCERLPRAAVREQPAPCPGGEAVWPSLLASGLVPESLRADCEARHRLGVKRYGRALETGNGRDALADAYQEALDLAVYLWQAHMEAGAGVSGSFWRRVVKDAVAVAENIKEAMP